MGDEADAVRDEYLFEQFIEGLRRATRRAPSDWHRRSTDLEPPCDQNQWRTRDRRVVMDMSKMSDAHLHHAIRFASSKPQHASRLTALLKESARRSKK